MHQTLSTSEQDSPFDLDNQPAYSAWRDRKLEGYPTRVEDLAVEIADPRRPSAAEQEAILTRCRKTNMAIYVGRTNDTADKAIPRELGRRFGLERLDSNLGADDDGITALQVADNPLHRRYIPYSERPIQWHTDGYYNSADRQIRGMVLHCARPASGGGENALMDPEIAYILLRDQDPEHIRALMAPDAMTIPPNVVDGEEIRPAIGGPVFSLMLDGSLHMRYTARTRSIEWRSDPATQAAVKALEALLAAEARYIFRATLQSGQGLICNNALHDRSRIQDDPEHPRLLYRLRYYDRMAGT